MQINIQMLSLQIARLLLIAEYTLMINRGSIREIEGECKAKQHKMR